jgi:hypothetical protein
MVTYCYGAGASLAVPSVSDTMGAVAANAGSTPLHLAAMKVRAALARMVAVMLVVIRVVSCSTAHQKQLQVHGALAS